MKAKQNILISQQPNYVIIFIYGILATIGLFICLDIASARDTMPLFYRFLFVNVIFSSLIMYAVSRIVIERFRNYFFTILIFTGLLLLLVVIKGVAAKGAVRSLRLWKISIQPSEIARIILILYFAHSLEKRKDCLKKLYPIRFLKSLIVPLTFIGLTYILIYVERHLSVLIISGVTLFMMLYFSDIPKRTLMLLALIGVIILKLVLSFGADYRSGRIEIFKKYSLFAKVLNLKPDQDVEIKDYQIRESLKGIIKGQVVGIGSKDGLVKHYYLPEVRTDYVFALIVEQWGFLGGSFILSLYIILFVLGFTISVSQPDVFVRYAGCGLAINLFMTALVNIGVAISALPSTGVTLPFISYGSSSYLMNAIGLGLILGISRKRK